MKPPPDVSSWSHLTRREALRKMSAGALWAAGLWPGALRARAAVSHPEFSFIVVNDTHYLDDDCGEWLRHVVAQMKAERPAFCLHLGDLVERCTRANLNAVKAIFSELGVPTYFEIGNHDYGGGDNRSTYEELFPNRINYHFTHEQWRFVGLDSTDGQRWEKTSIPDTTLRWVDEHIAGFDREQPMALFTHFPLGEGVAFRPANADLLLERFRNHNLQAIWSGHFHGHTARTRGAALLTTGRCCALKRDNHDGTAEKGFVVCTARDGRITQRFVTARAGSNA